MKRTVNEWQKRIDALRISGQLLACELRIAELRKRYAVFGEGHRIVGNVSDGSGGKGGGGVDKSGESGIMKSNTTDSSYDIPLTDEAIDKVPYIELEGFTQEQNKALQEAQKDVLRAVRDLPLGTEAGAIYCVENGKFERVGEIVIGEHGAHRVKLPDYDKPYIAVHNHPDGKTFSPDDVERMLSRPKNMGVVAIGHNASSYVFQATNSSEIVSFDFYIKSQVKKIQKGLSYNDFSNEIDKIWKAGANYGFIYKSV